jgi:amino acid permease
MEGHDNHQPSKRRETMLTVVLTGLGAGVFLLFLILVTGGFFFFVALAVVGITALGVLHYWLWGQSMTEDVAAEQAQDMASQESQREREMLRRRRH